MAESMHSSAEPSRDNIALGLGLLGLAALVVAIIATGNDDEPEWLWFIPPVIGLAALAAGFTTRQGGRFPVRALIGMVIGAALVVLFALFATGILE